MRSELALSILLAGGCATAQDKEACHPVASLATPAFGCRTAEPPPPPVVEEAPPPPPVEEEPPPPPPDKVIVKDDKIEILDHIQFKAGEATLLPVSEPILDEVAKVLVEHPELTKVSIEGHTDSQDTKKRNKKLSEKRAKAVKAYLVDHGVEAKRLTTKGFGEDVPIAGNDTPEGRFENRRVEFRIVKRD
jgi:outer membrane protein OmpA-like peptidoglycan-associated protein